MDRQTTNLNTSTLESSQTSAARDTRRNSVPELPKLLVPAAGLFPVIVCSSRLHLVHRFRHIPLEEPAGMPMHRCQVAAALCWLLHRAGPTLEAGRLVYVVPYGSVVAMRRYQDLGRRGKYSQYLLAYK